jgi:hypothetical protein
MKLAAVSFVSPIPIPGSHLRLSDFVAEPGPVPEFGWDIEDTEGAIWLRKGEIAFYTYVEGSCVPAKTRGAAEVAVHATPPVVAPETGVASKRKGKRG